MKISTCLIVSLFALFLGGAVRAQVPQLINYQGRVAVGTTNFNGTGQFKFAFVNTDGSVTYWSNDGTSVAGSQPTSGVTLTVTQGLYSLLLGDTSLANMTAVPATVFAQSDVRLRVWFDDGTNGWQLLSPDQRIAAVGYAMVAASVPNGAITSAQIANGAVGSSQIATGAIGSAQLATNIVVNGVFTSQGLSMPATTNSTIGTITMGGLPVLQTYGPNNLFAGANAGSFFVTGSFNTGVGARALATLLTGSNNTATGAGAMQINYVGSHNAAYGYLALSHTTNSNYNVAIGDSAMAASVVGSNNIAIGPSVLGSSVVGSNNVAIGGTNAAPVGSNNIYLSSSSFTPANEGNTIRIGTPGLQTNTYVAGVYGVSSPFPTNSPVAVTPAGQLVTVSQSYGYVLPGTLIEYAGTNPPIYYGYLVCNGALVSTSVYTNLFNAIGYSYGGSSNMFAVPNLTNTVVSPKGSYLIKY